MCYFCDLFVILTEMAQLQLMVDEARICFVDMMSKSKAEAKDSIVPEVHFGCWKQFQPSIISFHVTVSNQHYFHDLQSHRAMVC